MSWWAATRQPHEQTTTYCHVPKSPDVAWGITFINHNHDISHDVISTLQIMME